MRRMFDPAKAYHPEDRDWFWDSHKFGMSNDAIVGNLWRDYNTVAALPISRHSEFLLETKAVSARSKTKEEFLAGMKRNSLARFREQEHALESILYEVTGCARYVPFNIYFAICQFARAASMDNMCNILKAIRDHDWPKTPPNKSPITRSPIIADDENHTRFARDDSPPHDTWADMGEGPHIVEDITQAKQTAPETRNPPPKRRREESQGGCEGYDGGGDDTQTQSPGPPPKRLKSTHGKGSTQSHGLQPTNTSQPTSTHADSLLSSTRCPAISSVSTAPTDSTQLSRSSRGKRVRDEGDERSGDEKRRKITGAPRPPPSDSLPPKPAPSPTGYPPVSAAPVGAKQPDRALRRKLTRGDGDGRPSDIERRRITRAPRPSVSKAVPQQSASPTIPVSTRRQTRSTATALLELDNHGRPQQTSPASRHNHDTTQSRPRDAQRRRNGLRGNAKS